MSRRNGDRSRFQINRKRKLRRRQRVRALMIAIVARRAPETTMSDDRQRLEQPHDTSGAPE